MLEPIEGRGAMPKLPGVMPPGIMDKLLVEANGRIASLDPVEVGLSISMLIDESPTILLLCRRCRFEDMVEGREMEDAPGPGAVLGGAAAIGITPLPPTGPVDEVALPM